MPTPMSIPDVRTRDRRAPSVTPAGASSVPRASSGRARACCALAVCLAFAVDGTTTLRGLAAGGRELNPLVAGLAPAPYVSACVLRAAIALALLAATARARPPIRAVTRLACVLLVVVKLAAAASNLRGGV